MFTSSFFGRDTSAGEAVLGEATFSVRTPASSRAPVSNET